MTSAAGSRASPRGDLAPSSNERSVTHEPGGASRPGPIGPQGTRTSRTEDKACGGLSRDTGPRRELDTEARPPSSPTPATSDQLQPVTRHGHTPLPLFYFDNRFVRETKFNSSSCRLGETTHLPAVTATLLRKVKIGFPENKVFSRFWANLKWEKGKANSGKRKHEKQRPAAPPGAGRPREHTPRRPRDGALRLCPLRVMVGQHTHGRASQANATSPGSGAASHMAPHK